MARNRFIKSGKLAAIKAFVKWHNAQIPMRAHIHVEEAEEFMQTQTDAQPRPERVPNPPVDYKEAHALPPASVPLKQETANAANNG